MAISPGKTRALLKKISGLRILVIGDVMLDHYVWGDATRISPEAPVPVIDVSRNTYTAGGAGNVALNIASLGAKVELCGAIGRDDAGDKLLETLRVNSVGFDDKLRGDVATILKTRVVVRNQQMCRLDKEEPRTKYATLSIGLRDKIARKIGQVDAVIFSDYAKGFLSNDLLASIRDTARAAGKFVAWDPKPSGGLHVTDLDLITPNRKEALELSGLPVGADDHGIEPAICTRIWERYSPKNLVVTLGAHGMLLCRHGVIQKEIPTAAREVYDVSGAGDTVIASLTLAMAAGTDLETAAHFANAAAGVVVGKIGTATVTPKELVAYVSHTP